MEKIRKDAGFPYKFVEANKVRQVEEKKEGEEKIRRLEVKLEAKKVAEVELKEELEIHRIWGRKAKKRIENERKRAGMKGLGRKN